MKDLRLELRFKNNLILRRVEEMGYRSLMRFAKDHNLNYGHLAAIVSLSLSPLHGNKSKSESEIIYWRKIVYDLCTIFKCEPEDLFPEHIANLRQKRLYKLEMDAAEVSDFLLESTRQLALPPDQIYDKTELKETIKQQIATLTPREEKVIRLRFGLEGEQEMTLKQVSEIIGVHPERIRQIESKALRKLRHPIRYKKLLPFL